MRAKSLPVGLNGSEPFDDSVIPGTLDSAGARSPVVVPIVPGPLKSVPNGGSLVVPPMKKLNPGAISEVSFSESPTPSRAAPKPTLFRSTNIPQRSPLLTTLLLFAMLFSVELLVENWRLIAALPSWGNSVNSADSSNFLIIGFECNSGRPQVALGS